MPSLKIDPAVLAVCNAINRAGRAVIVGGYVRNFFFDTTTVDIDIEVYEIAHISTLETLLAPFGRLHYAGASFGVMMLSYGGFHFDIALARKENAVGIGHKDFHVTAAPFEAFETIALRRDFTMNALGFDTKSSKLLDPFKGRQAIQMRRLEVVNARRFAEDALRVLRAVGFISRFNLSATPTLLSLSKEIVQTPAMRALSKERIFDEVAKWFTKAQNLTSGFLFLEEIGLVLFPAVQRLASKDPAHFELALLRLNRSRPHLVERLVLLYGMIDMAAMERDLLALSHDKKTIQKALRMAHGLRLYIACYERQSDADMVLMKLARSFDYHSLETLCDAYDPSMAQWLKDRTLRLGVYLEPIPALVSGHDLINAGMKPDAFFGTYLETLYTLQLEHPVWSKEALLENFLGNHKPRIG